MSRERGHNHFRLQIAMLVAAEDVQGLNFSWGNTFRMNCTKQHHSGYNTYITGTISSSLLYLMYVLPVKRQAQNCTNGAIFVPLQGLIVDLDT